jgi:hypothetical protein
MLRFCRCFKKNKKNVLIRKNSNIDKIINKDIYYISYKKLEDECIICLNYINIDDEVALLKWGHTYHKQCIHNWFLKKQVCPLCNIKIKI